MLRPLTSAASQPTTPSSRKLLTACRRSVAKTYAVMNKPPNTFRQTSIAKSATGISRVK